MVMISMVFVYRGYLEIFLWPVIFPLEAGFGTANWLFGFILAACLALVGLLLLYIASPRLNLSRAAQESNFRWASQQVSLLGDSSLSRQMKIRNRLGIQHPPSRIPGRAGAWSLLWKDFVVSQRGINFGFVAVWVGIFGISLVLAAAPDWGTRFWAFIIWCWLVGQRGTERLRSDLELWTMSSATANFRTSDYGCGIGFTGSWNDTDYLACDWGKFTVWFFTSGIYHSPGTTSNHIHRSGGSV